MAKLKRNASVVEWEPDEDEVGARERGLKRYGNDFKRFAEEQLWVTNRDARAGDRIVLLKYNNAQLYLDNLKKSIMKFNMMRSKEAHKHDKREPISPWPVKVRALKARKVGWSTKIQADIFSRCEWNAGTHALVMSHEQKSSQNIGFMARRFHFNYRPERTIIDGNCRRPLVGLSLNKIQWDEEWDSSITIVTAGGGGGAARSFTFQIIHISEEAHFPSDSDEMAAAEAAAGSCEEIYHESTANGQSGLFYEGWQNSMWLEDAIELHKAKKPMPDWWNGEFRAFWPWHEDPEYRVYLPEHEKSYLKDNLTEMEANLKDQFKLTLEQLQWRRKKIKGECAKQTRIPDPELYFAQEYPATPEEAFVSKGINVFSQPKINAMRVKAEKTAPIWWGNLHRQPSEFEDNKINEWKLIKTNTPREGRFHIFEFPVDGAAYSTGVDAAEGLDHGDWSVIRVWRRVDNQQARLAASFRSKTPAAELGDLADFIGRMFNDSFMVPEKNAPGNVTCLRLAELSYPHLYVTRNVEQIGGHQTAPTSFTIGFRTTSASKRIIIDCAIDALMSDQLFMQDPQGLHEWQIFQNDNGRCAAPKGECDDIVMADMLALYGHYYAAPPIQMWESPTTAEELKGLTQEDVEADVWKKIRAIKDKGTKKHRQNVARMMQRQRTISKGLYYRPLDRDPPK